jgi:DNA-binding XRE family transcriptional regulator
MTIIKLTSIQFGNTPAEKSAMSPIFSLYYPAVFMTFHVKGLGMTPTPAQIRAARSLLGITAAELAKASGVNQRTVLAIETGNHSNPTVKTFEAIKTALESRGIEWIGETGVDLRGST